MRISDWSSDVCSSDLHFGVGGGEEVRQAFQDRDLRAEAVPDAAQLQADHAGTDDAQALGHLVDIQRADVEIGRASCRERVCQYVQITVVAGTLKKKQQTPRS